MVFSGAGMSAESGISTFRDAGGLWEQHDIQEVATPDAFRRNPSMVLGFYNQRRRQVLQTMPNKAHHALVALEDKYHVQIITQNIDDLHERAGSANVIHLHGEIRKSRSTRFPELVYDIDGEELNVGDTCERGYQLRPHIVWFGELVPMIEIAAEHVSACDILIVIGTSLEVYPAASLVHCAGDGVRKFLVDPAVRRPPGLSNLEIIEKPAGTGVPELVARLMSA